MRTLVIGAIVLALTAGAANAGIITDPGLGALQMTLVWDTNGDAYLMNNTGTNKSVDGYEIRSTALDLSPTDGNWRSIADWYATDWMACATALGPGAGTFGELTATTKTLAEASLSSTAVFAPGVQISMGTPLAVPPVPGVLTFYYGLSTDTTTDKYLGLVAQIPEPVTIGLLAIGACVALVRRRR